MMKYLKRLSKWRNSSGFTLTEVIVSTALLGILIVGILMFMTPIFNMSTNSKANQKADLAATTMELYLSKSLRSSLYVKVFTGVSDEDVDQKEDAVYKDEQFETMVNFVKANSDSYELRCISIRYEEDTNPSNESEGDNPHKYFLYNETYGLNEGTLLRKSPNDKSELIFDVCFYEDIYPAFEFSRRPVCFDKNGNVLPETYDSDGNITPKHEDVNGVKADPWPHDSATYSTTLYPVLEMNIYMYENETMERMSRVFEGKSYIEVNNVKSLQLNGEGKYKIFEPEAISAGSLDSNKDIYIFYVARKAGTVLNNKDADKETTESEEGTE